MNVVFKKQLVLFSSRGESHLIEVKMCGYYQVSDIPANEHFFLYMYPPFSAAKLVFGNISPGNIVLTAYLSFPQP